MEVFYFAIKRVAHRPYNFVIIVGRVPGLVERFTTSTFNAHAHITLLHCKNVRRLHDK